MTVCVDGGITNATDSDDAPFPILASLALRKIAASDRKWGVESEAVLDRRGKSLWGSAGHLLSAARAAFGKGAAPVHSQLTLIAVLWQAVVRWGAALPTAGGFHGRDQGKKEVADGAYRAARAG